MTIKPEAETWGLNSPWWKSPIWQAVDFRWVSGTEQLIIFTYYHLATRDTNHCYGWYTDRSKNQACSAKLSHAISMPLQSLQILVGRHRRGRPAQQLCMTHLDVTRMPSVMLSQRALLAPCSTWIQLYYPRFLQTTTSLLAAVMGTEMSLPCSAQSTQILQYSIWLRRVSLRLVILAKPVHCTHPCVPYCSLCCPGSCAPLRRTSHWCIYTRKWRGAWEHLRHSTSIPIARFPAVCASAREAWTRVVPTGRLLSFEGHSHWALQQLNRWFSICWKPENDWQALAHHWRSGRRIKLGHGEHPDFRPFQRNSPPNGVRLTSTAHQLVWMLVFKSMAAACLQLHCPCKIHVFWALIWPCLNFFFLSLIMSYLS